MDSLDGPVVNAAVTSFEVLDAVRTLDEPGVSEVARYLDRSKSGVYKHLHTLTQLGYLTRTGESYRVGLGTWAAGTEAADRFPIEEGTRTVESLAASIDHSTALVLYEDGRAYYAYQHCSSGVRERIGAVGDRLPLHATAAGKAILAYLPPQRRDAALASCSMPAYTDATVTDVAALRSTLETVRERRTALERDERTAGLASLAAPILGADGSPIGALTVVGLTEDLDTEAIEDKMVSLVVNAARSVENTIDRE